MIFPERRWTIKKSIAVLCSEMHLRPLYYKIEPLNHFVFIPFSQAFEILCISAGGNTFAINEFDFHDSEHVYPLSTRTQRLKNLPSDGSEKIQTAGIGDNCFNGQLMVL
ncbi:hypothetical protein CDAR_588321 [Caerostris darwini]|uniref:Uncharacterized protein n=1 Tax=Caerostris darwini TaxID=1538125 RepID=A0AAV4S8F4_9ARAC|nr:hypothetical protein CDAR_588321 [Caerostris darwini]